MKIEVDLDRCEGHGLCAAYAPAVFAMQADDYPYVMAEDLSPGDEGTVYEAAASCPTQAITVT